MDVKFSTFARKKSGLKAVLNTIYTTIFFKKRA